MTDSSRAQPSAPGPLPWSYDAIAGVYATDMGRSMPFDDAGWYRALCLSHGGSALELGCGTGRILIELLAAGIDAFGADRSLPMLQQLQRDARGRGIAPRVAEMDLRALALAGEFDTILLPYSLITYVTDPAEAAAVLAGLHARLTHNGIVALDAFVPQPVASFADFRLDYRRAHGDGVLERHKRITANADGTNRIERRYRLFDAATALREEFFTDETIRPYAPEALEALASAAGFAIARWAWDYGTRTDAQAARFATAVLRART